MIRVARSGCRVSWTGAAHIAVIATLDGQQPTTLEFNTNPAPGQTHLTEAVGDPLILHLLWNW